MREGGTEYPEPALTTADGYYVRPPPFGAPPDAPGQDASAREKLRGELKALSHEELVERLAGAELRLRKWEASASELVTTLALSPDMTEGLYARSLRDLLSAALLTLESVDGLRHVECSMPCVAAEAPHVSMREWAGLDYSEWDVEWSPSSWWVSVSADGSRWGLGFNVLTRVSAMRLEGALRCAFSKDLTSMRTSFMEKPCLEMDVESSVGWGVVPIPVRVQIEAMVRAEIERFVEQRLTGDESMVVVLRRKALAKITESDLLEARDQAKRSSNVNLRSALLL